MPRLQFTFILFVAGLLSGLSAAGGDWARFRGPNGSGISADTERMPTAWNETTNVKWKTPLPGPGSSSPIVVGDRVFVTSWSGYGLSRDEPGEQAKLRRHLSCIDRNNGQIVWTTTVEPFLPEDEYGGMFAEHGYASHTPVSDGKHVFVFFGKTGALAFDMEGNQLWHTELGAESDPRGWGSASSPIVHENLLFVTATAESEALAALDKATGEVVWKQEATGFNGVWGTPVLAPTGDGRTDLVIAVTGEVWGFAPATGKLRWFCKSPGPSPFCSSAVVQDGIIYAMETGRGGGGGIAVRAGGKGDVTDSHTVWTGNQSNRIGTPLEVDGRIYAFSSGIATCFDASTGEQIFRGRLRSSGGSRPSGGQGRRGRGGGSDYSSPVMADGKIYFTSRGGDTYVLEAGEQFKQLAVNRVTSEREDFSATPAISDGELFIRSSGHLYCVARLEELVQPPPSQDAVEDAAAADTPAGGRGGAGRGGRGGQGGQGGRGGRGGQGGRGGRGGFDPAAIFTRRDANGDGKLSGDELAGPLQERLDEIDTDKDQAISREEFQTGMQRLFRGGRGGGGGRGGRGGGRPGSGDRPPRPPLDVAP